MRLAGYGLAPLLGAATAVAVVVLHRTPLGLLLGAVATLVVLGVLRQGRRTPVVLFAAGWVPAVVLLAPARPDGGYLVGTDLPGLGLLVLWLAVLVVAALSIPSRHSEPRGPAT